MNLYGIYDKKGEAFKFFFAADNDDVARRPVYDILSLGDNEFVKFPDDFAVYKLASLNIRTGAVYSKDMKNIVFEVRSLFQLANDPALVEDSAGSEATPSGSEEKSCVESEA